jgi:hypothetical protein
MVKRQKIRIAAQFFVGASAIAIISTQVKSKVIFQFKAK